ncbi:MAG: hypothetical protein NTZ16_15825, partial [Verrucomicrobia bacterium]|nr:hypothetical protein [Verrucomicrobiota bacterium]
MAECPTPPSDWLERGAGDDGNEQIRPGTRHVFQPHAKLRCARFLAREFHRTLVKFNARLVAFKTTQQFLADRLARTAHQVRFARRQMNSWTYGFAQPAKSLLGTHNELVPNRQRVFAASRRRKGVADGRIGEDASGEHEAMNVKRHIRLLPHPGCLGGNDIFVVDVVEDRRPRVLTPEKMPVQSAGPIVDFLIEQV